MRLGQTSEDGASVPLSLQMSSIRYFDKFVFGFRSYHMLTILSRLASQHLLWKNHLGFLLHPTVALDVQPEIFRVAEIGTRTG